MKSRFFNRSNSGAALVALLLALVTALAAFVGCTPNNGKPEESAKPAESAAPKQADLSEVYEKLVASGKLPALTKVPDRDIYEVYGIDKDKLKQWAFALSENYAVNAGEVALFEVNDASYAGELAEKLQKHLDQNKKVAKNYSDPKQAEKLEPVEVTTVGTYVYFVVGEDYGALMQILKDNIG